MKFMYKAVKYILVVLLVFVTQLSIAQQLNKLPMTIFLQLIQQTEKMELNHATKFEHVSLPPKHHNTFMSYVKDSVATLIPGLVSPLYYQWQLKDGMIINGDVYWNEQHSYILFKIGDNQYINYFSRDGVQQLKSLFKL